MNTELLTATDARKKAEFYKEKAERQEKIEKYEREFLLQERANRIGPTECKRIHEIISVKAKKACLSYAENVNPYNIYLIDYIREYFEGYGYKVRLSDHGFVITW